MEYTRQSSMRHQREYITQSTTTNWQAITAHSYHCQTDQLSAVKLSTISIPSIHTHSSKCQSLTESDKKGI